MSALRKESLQILALLPHGAQQFLEGIDRGGQDVCAQRPFTLRLKEAPSRLHKGSSLQECADRSPIAKLVGRERQNRRLDAGHIFAALPSHLRVDRCRGTGRLSQNFNARLEHIRRVSDLRFGRGLKCKLPLVMDFGLTLPLAVFNSALLFKLEAGTFALSSGETIGSEDRDHSAQELRPGSHTFVDFNRVQQLRSEAAKLKVQMRLPRLIDGSSTLKRGLAQLLGAAAMMVATPALADPCKAVPDRGPLPSYLSRGATFSGPVTYVGDGDSLCVEVGRGPSTWVEVRVADFYAPELNAPGGRDAKAALERITRGKRAVCTVGHRSYDRIVANCRIEGVSIGELMRRQGISEGGNGR